MFYKTKKIVLNDLSAQSENIKTVKYWVEMSSDDRSCASLDSIYEFLCILALV